MIFYHYLDHVYILKTSSESNRLETKRRHEVLTEGEICYHSEDVPNVIFKCVFSTVREATESTAKLHLQQKVRNLLKSQ